MRPKTTTGWLGKFLGLSVVSMLQNVFAQLFLWLLAFAIVSAIIVLGANKFDTHEEGSHNGPGAKKMLERHAIARNISIQFGGFGWSGNLGIRFTDGIAPPHERFERDLVFHGLMGIYDLPRPEFKDCTARAIATDVCIFPSSGEIRMLPADVARTTMTTAQGFAANINFVISLLTGLAFKDNSNVSVSLSTPIRIIWMLLGTDAFSETGLGFETAAPDIPNRPPQDAAFTPTLPQINTLRYGIFTPEFMLVYGILMAGCVLGSFITATFGFSNGNLGLNCNNACSPSMPRCLPCPAQRPYTAMAWIFLLFSRELKDFRRPSFNMHKGAGPWGDHLWGNWFLFFAITAAFFMVVYSRRCTLRG
ncbi:hypothetical protein GGI42DRAFT_349333 [Trichoderma sp. SZMC 28013]